MPSTCRPWSPCATTQTSSGSMKSSGRPESHQSWPSPPSCESSSSSQTPSSETSAAGSAISLDQHGYSKCFFSRDASRSPHSTAGPSCVRRSASRWRCLVAADESGNARLDLIPPTPPIEDPVVTYPDLQVVVSHLLRQAAAEFLRRQGLA